MKYMKPYIDIINVPFVVNQKLYFAQVPVTMFEINGNNRILLTVFYHDNGLHYNYPNQQVNYIHTLDHLEQVLNFIHNNQLATYFKFSMHYPHHNRPWSESWTIYFNNVNPKLLLEII